MYNLNMQLTDEEIIIFRLAQHEVQAPSMSAFIRECVRLRLADLGMQAPQSGTLKTEAGEDVKTLNKALGGKRPAYTPEQLDLMQALKKSLTPP